MIVIIFQNIILISIFLIHTMDYPLEFVLHLLFALERGSIEIEELYLLVTL